MPTPSGGAAGTVHRSGIVTALRLQSALVMLLCLLSSQVHGLVPHHHHHGSSHSHEHSHSHDGVAHHHEDASASHGVEQSNDDHEVVPHHECQTSVRTRTFSSADVFAIVPLFGLTIELPEPVFARDEHLEVLLPYATGPPGEANSRAPPLCRIA